MSQVALALYREPLADIGGPGLLIALFAVAGIGVVILGLGGILLESVVLWRWLHLGYGRALRDALVMNVVSGVIGVPLIGVITGSPAGIMFGLGGGFVLSVLIEGFILLRRHRDDALPPARLWQAALLANALSYAILAILVLATNALGTAGRIF